MTTENLFESTGPLTSLIAEPRNNFFLETKALIKLFLPLLLSQITYAISLFAAILQASRYAHEKFRPSCPRNLFASRDYY